MPTYTIIAGVNGTGKTSLTGVLKAERRDLGFVIDVDKIISDNQCTPLKGGKIAVSKIRDLLSRGLSFTQETTLSGYKTLDTIKIAKAKGYTVRLFYIGLNSHGESIKRIKNRVEKGGHNIDSSDVIQRFTNRFQSLIRILPYVDEVHFYDNENGFVEVAEFRNGELITKGDYRPAWVKALAQELTQI